MENRFRLRSFLLSVALASVIAAACTSDPVDTSDGGAERDTTAAPTATATTSTAAPTTTAVPATTVAATTEEPATSLVAEGELPEVENPGSEGLGDPYVGTFGNGGYDVASYDLEITWDQTAENLDGVTTIEATATEDLGSLNLDLYKLEVIDVEVNGVTAQFVREGNEIVIVPGGPIAEGEDFTVSVAYSGTPQREPGRLGSSAPSGWKTLDDSAYVLGEPIAAATFHPANDHPSDKARFTYRLTASADQTVVAGGNFISKIENDDGTITWVYEQDEPLATYLTTMMFGPFEVREDGTSSSGIPIRNVFYTPLADRVEPIFEKQPEMMDVFEPLFGPYPFDIYGSAVVNDEVGGALETQTLSVFGNDVLFFGPFAERVVAHELAHQWFGNAVSVENWEDLWLNEGFATYAEALWLERSDPDFEMAQWLLEAGSLGPLLREHVHMPPEDDLFGAQVYVRGGLTLHALRLEVGDEIFFDILRTWVVRFGGANANTADFEALAEELSGQDLGEFFDGWLRAKEIPELDGFTPLD